MRFLNLCAAIFIVFVAGTFSFSQDGTHLSYSTPQISIVMEDVIMSVTVVDHTVGTISSVTVKDLIGNLVLHVNGCGTKCQVDLSSLSNGTYNTYVNTSSGQSFSESVTIDK